MPQESFGHLPGGKKRLCLLQFREGSDISRNCEGINKQLFYWKKRRHPNAPLSLPPQVGKQERQAKESGYPIAPASSPCIRDTAIHCQSLKMHEMHVQNVQTHVQSPYVIHSQSLIFPFSFQQGNVCPTVCVCVCASKAIFCQGYHPGHLHRNLPFALEKPTSAHGVDCALPGSS